MDDNPYRAPREVPTEVEAPATNRRVVVSVSIVAVVVSAELLVNVIAGIRHRSANGIILVAAAMCILDRLAWHLQIFHHRQRNSSPLRGGPIRMAIVIL